MKHHIRMLFAAFSGAIGLLAIVLWARSFQVYDSVRTCVGSTLVEAKSSRGSIGLELTSPWPSPGAVVTTWDAMRTTAEAPAPDIGSDEAILGFAWERKSMLVVLDEPMPATSAESDGGMFTATTAVKSHYLLVPIWAIVLIAMTPPMLWIKHRLKGRGLPAALLGDVPPASDCPPAASPPRSAGPS